MEQSSWGFQGSLLATGAALAGRECDSVGNGGCAASNAAGADGLAGLQALAR